MNYRSDHIKVIKFLGKELPKKPSFKVADIAKIFADVKAKKPDTALVPDRACRNALRKPRKEGHIEIVDRGEYRISATGIVFLKKLDSYEVAPERRDDVEKPAKKVAKVTKIDKVAKIAKVAKKDEKPATKVGKKVAKAEKKVAAATEKKPTVKSGGFRLPKSKKPENVAPVEDSEPVMAAEESEEESAGSHLAI